MKEELAHTPRINRREFGMIGLASGTISVSAADADGTNVAPPSPNLEFSFQVTVTLGDPLELGTRGGVRSRFVPITGGVISGPRLQGIVLPGGGDWQEIGGDGATSIHARYMLRAADGTAISVDNPGIRISTPEIIARLTAGEDLDPALYYFRTTPSFAVAIGPHEWLRRNVFVCQGIRHPSSVALRVFRVT